MSIAPRLRLLDVPANEVEIRAAKVGAIGYIDFSIF
jgi:hypothetical protein